MFVFSFSKKNIFKIIIPCVVISLSLIVLYTCSVKMQNKEKTDAVISNNASDIENIMKFISSFGWLVNKEPDEVREVIIPKSFDEVYKNYNSIQLKQGYDLSSYAGQKVKKWTFTIKNYPEYENEEFIKINILVCDSTVIGGDVCSIKLDGFMHGFKKEE